ncbi:chloride channel protein [Bermanella marisrubri]|uniref:Chloride channel, putative n=1 Tax=Bermanella marisrubri TaxID=207949 RepID=Q1N3I5_9GAMM|nr:chloride channel protein [Bermanella marisrubri]EAT12889.1 chloride channel, putative [Oceanobacter sp. RED65] [Bermanella marisrubri]QIZ83207.1 chloride channel protein [Bermanella marisrubri]
MDGLTTENEHPFETSRSEVAEKGMMKVIKNALFVVLFGSVVGVVSAIFADLFVYGFKYLNQILNISAASQHESISFWWILLVPCIGGLVVGLFNRYINPDKPQGPPDVIAAAQLGHSQVPFKSGMSTALASFMSLGSGASVGGYGPIVHLGATLGVAFRKFAYGGGGHIANIGIGCGVAGAIAAAFNAPLAGMFFAHEVVLRHYSLRAFAPITVSATMGYIVTAVILERPPLFQIDQIGHLNAWEYSSFMLIGVTGAMLAVVFMRTLLKSQKIAQGLNMPNTLKPALAGFALGLVALQLPELLGLGTALLQSAMIPESIEAPQMAMLLVGKLVVTAMCLGFGFVGGVFSPSLVIGVLFGSLVGLVLAPIMPGAADSLGVFAICGMAAVTTAVIGAPISTILIILELTRNYELTTAVLLSVVFSNLVSYRLFGRSFFDHVLEKRGLDLTKGRDALLIANTSISESVHQAFVKVGLKDKPSDVLNLMTSNNTNVAHVVDQNDEYQGAVLLSDMAMACSVQGVHVEDVNRFMPKILEENASVEQGLTILQQSPQKSIPVLSSDNKLVGVVNQQSLLGQYRDTLHKVRSDENAA